MDCVQIVRKWLYLTRCGRHDLGWLIQKLWRSVTKWSKAHDNSLLPLTSFVHKTRIIASLPCWRQNRNLIVYMFQDASFVGDLQETKPPHLKVCSASLRHAESCKSAVSSCRFEAEVTWFDTRLRMERLPALRFLSQAVLSVSDHSCNFHEFIT